MKYFKIIFIYFIFIFLIIGNQQIVFASSKTMTVHLGTSPSQTQSTTVNIPSLVNIKSISSNTGNASYSTNGNNVTILAANGSSVSSTAPSKIVSDSKTSSSNNFSETIYYNNEGYSGNISKNGTSTSTTVQTGGTYTPANTKQVTIMSGYTSYRYWKYDGTTWVNTGSSNNGSLTYSYNQDGYTGTLNFLKGTEFIPSAPSNSGTYVGQTTTTSEDNVVYYTGNVTKPASDTRTYSTTYTQNYSGTVYGATTYYYAYDITLNYIDDTTPPTIPTINPSTINWTNNNITFTITSGIDIESGVSKSQYQIDGGSWSDYTGSVSISTNGIHTINARTIDNIGNISSISSITVRIDKTSPTAPTITPSTTNWTNNNVTFTITNGNDTLSGISKSQYQIDGGSWINYTGSVSISTNGIHTINARTIDNAGNISSNTISTAKIDKGGPTAPTIIPSTTNWTNNNVTFTIDNGIDNESGILKSQYQIDGGSWSNYVEMVTISSEGIHTINARTIDNIGNVGILTSINVRIDKTNPGAAVITPSTVNWTNNDVTISINNGTDALSGTAKSQYQIDSGIWTDYINIITVADEGIHTINAKTFDKAGNVSSISSTIVKVDKTSAAAVINPSSYDGSRININYNTMPTNAASVIHLNNIIDNLSGVSNVKVWFTKSSDISNTVGSNYLDFDITSGTTDKDLSIQLPEDSIYGDNIHFEITDNAGNKSYFYGNIQLEILVPEVPAVSGIVNDKLYLKGENININWTYKDDNTPVLPQGKVDFIFTNVESNSVTTKTLEGTAASYQIPVDNIPDGITKVKVRVYNSGNKYSDSSESTIRINRFNPNGKILTKTIELADSIQFASVYTDYVMPKNTSIKCILYYWNENASCFDENHKVILNIANKNALAQLPYSTNKFKIKYILTSKDIINVAGTDYAKVSPTITSCRLYGK